MRRLSPFTVEMGRPTPGLDDLAFSLSREFGAPDIRSACDALEDLACELMTAAFLSPVEQCTACSLLLGSTARLRSARDLEPSAFMVDRVLDRREGHPLALALVYSEVGRKAGIPLWPAGNGERFLVGYVGVETSPARARSVRRGEASRRRRSAGRPQMALPSRGRVRAPRPHAGRVRAERRPRRRAACGRTCSHRDTADGRAAASAPRVRPRPRARTSELATSWRPQRPSLLRGHPVPPPAMSVTRSGARVVRRT